MLLKLLIVKHKYKQNYLGINRGFALALVLFSLAAISLIVGLIVKAAFVDGSLSNSQTDRSVSKQMAELALVDARDDIMCNLKINGGVRSDSDRTFNYKIPFYGKIADDTCVGGLCGRNTSTTTQFWDSLHSASSFTLGFATYGQFTGKISFNNNITGTAQYPRYIIETIQTNIYTGNPVDNEYQYRITAVGYGRYSAKVYTKLQIIFRAYKQTCGYNYSATRNSYQE
ncbi:MAG: hypothetical protein RLZZ210_1821 [Pseudomonadota bacterium]|jgi:Tfp pilus assembly protein PilX